MKQCIGVKLHNKKHFNRALPKSKLFRLCPIVLTMSFRVGGH